MRGAPDRVLILGCGTIGQIKAALWLSMGMEVYVHDVNSVQIETLLRKDKRLKQFDDTQVGSFLVDISTPNDQHGSSLEWVFDTVKYPRIVLIEKPICTTAEGKSLIKELLNTHKSTLVYINESYFWSSALDWLLERMNSSDETLSSVKITLSKNRLADTRSGRFFDKELEAYAIELPHAVAIMQKLGISIDSLMCRDNTMYRKGEISHNQGTRVSFTSMRGTTIALESFLGDFRFDRRDPIANVLTRELVVTTNRGNNYRILFDPAPGVERFKSVVIVNENEKIVLDDDHLRKHLEHVLSGEVSYEMNQFLSPNNSFAVYDFLSELYDGRIEKHISDDVNNYKEVGEIVRVKQWQLK